MKVYVDELPIKVRQSVIHYDDGKTNCLILEFSEDVKPSEICETKTLKQQVRKEVCEEVKKKVLKHFNVKSEEEYEKSLSLLDALFTADVLFEVLDQIQGE